MRPRQQSYKSGQHSLASSSLLSASAKYHDSIVGKYWGGIAIGRVTSSKSQAGVSWLISYKARQCLDSGLMKIKIEPQLMANWESPRWEFPQSNLLLHTRSTNQESILTSSLYQLHFSPSAWKSHFCVTQLKLYTDKLSSTIFCCLSDVRHR